MTEMMQDTVILIDGQELSGILVENSERIAILTQDGLREFCKSQVDSVIDCF